MEYQIDIVEFKGWLSCNGFYCRSGRSMFCTVIDVYFYEGNHVSFLLSYEENGMVRLYYEVWEVFSLLAYDVDRVKRFLLAMDYGSGNF